jgi:hypothetical protein
MTDEIYKRLKEYLRYDQETGHFTWIKSPSANVKAGSIAGGPDTCGYWRISIFGKFHSAHRLVFLYLNGEMPAGEVDHVNGNKADNRLANLRVCDRGQNCQNVRARKDNRLGIKGLRVTKSGAIEAQVIASKQRYSKTFSTIEEAQAWLAQKRAELHGRFAHGG